MERNPVRTQTRRGRDHSAHRIGGPEAGTTVRRTEWILARLSHHRCERHRRRTSGGYQFNAYADTLYDFIWRDVCDVYLEAVKPTIDDSPQQQAVLGAVLDAVLRILHPVCPFVTEALWPHVSAVRFGHIEGVELPPSELLAVAAWPVVIDGTVDESVVDTWERADRLVGAIRAVRSERNVKPKQLVTVHAPAPVRELITAGGGAVQTLAGVGEVVASEDGNGIARASRLTFEGSEVLISGLVDEANRDVERARLEKQRDAKSKQVAGFEARLANPGYVNNAKPELVDETRALLDGARDDLAAIEAALTALDAEDGLGEGPTDDGPGDGA